MWRGKKKDEKGMKRMKRMTIGMLRQLELQHEQRLLQLHSLYDVRNSHLHCLHCRYHQRKYIRRHAARQCRREGRLLGGRSPSTERTAALHAANVGGAAVHEPALVIALAIAIVNVEAADVTVDAMMMMLSGKLGMAQAGRKMQLKDNVGVDEQECQTTRARRASWCRSVRRDERRCCSARK